MTRKEIIARRREIWAAINTAKLAMEHHRLDLKALQAVCPHPKQRKYSAMGEIGDYCPDCEWQT